MSAATIRSAALVLAIAASGCGAAPDESSLPERVWVRRSRAAKRNAMGDIDARTSPDGPAAMLDVPAAAATAEAGGAPNRLVWTGGSTWTRPEPADLARDPELAAGEPALGEFHVTRRDGASVPLVIGAQRSEPGLHRFTPTGVTERLGSTTWWEFRRLPVAD